MKTFLVVLLGLFGVFLLLVVAGIFNWFSQNAPRQTAGTLREIDAEGVRLSYYVQGAGTPVLLVPSLGRSASDFNELAAALVSEGYRTIAVEPRGMRDATGLDDASLTLFDLADDVARIVDAETKPDARIAILGHAFGNRVARAYAVRYGARVSHLILVAAGGKVNTDPRIIRALHHVFWAFMPDFWRLGEVHLGFFARGNKVPDYWLGGWQLRTANIQGKTIRNTPSETWWAGGTAPMLVVQGMEDRIAPPEHTAVLLKEEFGARVSVAEIERAGHALLPEKPDAIRDAVLEFLGR